MTDDLLQFVSFLEAFPSAVAKTVGNGLTAEKILAIKDEILQLANMPKTPESSENRAYGARNPNEKIPN